MAEHIITTEDGNKENLTKHITDNVLEHGFDKCGVCPTQPLLRDKSYYLKWLDQNHNAGMKYLEKNLQTRFDTREIFPGAKSMVVVLKNYYTQAEINDSRFSIAKYAFCKDYHSLIKLRLNKVLNELQQHHPGINGRAFVDTAPIFERSNAVKAGLGFIGKNRCLINPEIGSFSFIGIIVVDVELSYNNKIINDSCGNCNLCIDSCPTGALNDGYFDARKCISYHTIENKEQSPEKIRKKITNQLFGCDICQNVCPFNANLNEQKDPEFAPLKIIKELKLEQLINMTDREFNTHYKETVLLRAGRNKLIENFETLTNKNSIV